MTDPKTSHVTKTVPAKKAAKKATAAPPALNVASLAASVTAAPAPRRSASGELSTLIDAAGKWLEESWKAGNGTLGAGRQVPVPDANVKQVKYALNVAARQAGLGVAIRDGESKNGTTLILFAAKKRKQKKEAPAATAPATPSN